MKLSAFAKFVLPEYRKKDVDGDGKDDTLCNWFVNRVAQHVGCDELKGLLANQIVELLGQSWILLDQDEAQEQANSGHLVIAGWANPAGHGHVALVIPGKISWSRQFGDDVPNGANAGNTTFYGRPMSHGFRKNQKPCYWMWQGQPKEAS